MTWSLDARIPVTLVGQAGLAPALADRRPTALLLPMGLEVAPGAVAAERFDAALPHAAACACCGGRSPAATALDRLFQARVRGHSAWFDRVLAVVDGELARQLVTSALTEDRVVSARFRPA